MEFRKTFHESELTKREIEILQLVKMGLSNKEIASRLFISLETVKKHLKNTYAKLDVKNRAQATFVLLQQRA